MKVLELKSDDFVVGVANLRNILNQKDVTNVTREHQHRASETSKQHCCKLWKQDSYLEIRYLRKIPAFLGRLWLYYISGDCAPIPRQSTNCNQKHGGFWPNLRHFDVTVSLFSCRTPLTRYLSGKNLNTSRGQWMAP